MIRDLLILPDGRQLFSGAGEDVVIKSLCYTKQVSGAGELDFRCAAAAEISVELLDKTAEFTIEPGTVLQYYRVDEEGNRLLMGKFYVEKPVRPEKYTLEFTAYDAMILAEKDVTAILMKQSWPTTVQALASRVCQMCGISLQTPGLCNGTMLVNQFFQKVTGRQIIALIAEINGMFAHITPEGKVAFASVVKSGRTITRRDQKSCKISEAPCAPIDQVAIRQQVEDVGQVYPSAGNQTYTITANPLTATVPANIRVAAQKLHTKLKGLFYTPMEAEVFVDTLELPWQPGQLVMVETGDRTVQSAVFSMSLRGNLAQLKSWGQPNRNSTAGKYNRDTVKILQQQMAQVQVEVEGVGTEVSRVEAELTDQTVKAHEDISALQVVSDKIFAQVSQVETAAQIDLDLVQKSVQTLKKQVDLSVTAQQLELSMASMAENGVQKVQTKTGYTFDQEGLSIADSRSDVHNLINYNGMYVSRGTDVILQADADGVIARDVKVHNYLVVGDHARLEDYQINRTACFWL